MTWSGTTPVPDGDRVEPLPAELRADLDRGPREPSNQHESLWRSDWILWVGAAIVVGIPLIVAFWAATQ